LKEFASHTTDQTDIIYGDLNFLDIDNNSSKISNYPSNLSFEYFTRRTLPHQATLIKRSLFEEIGLYDTSYKIVSDWGFFCLAICKYQKSYKKVPLVIANFPTDGIGSKQINARLDERKRFLNQHFKLFVDDYHEYSSLKNALPIRIVNKLFKYY
jgi:hypothetical protein